MPKDKVQSYPAQDELARILRRFGETYLGDDRPETMSFWKKFIFSSLGAVSSTVTASLEISNKNLRAAREVEKLNTQGQSLDDEVILTLLEVANVGYEFFLLGYLVVALVVCIVISFGIKHGGPLRLFFLGITVPVAIVLIATRAIQ